MNITKKEAEIIANLFLYMVINNHLEKEELVLLEKLQKFVSEE